MKTSLTDLTSDRINDILYSGNQLCDGSLCNQTLLEFNFFSQPPYLLAIAGVVISILCGFAFVRQIENRLNQWKKYRLSLLPLNTIQLKLSYSGVLLGVILFISGSLQVFGLQYENAFFFGLFLSLITGGALWAQLEQLMKQVESGEFKVVDFDNFDQFF